MSYILQTINLEKNIKGRSIISNLNIHVNKGEIYGFLGPNGAGKTSVMKMIMNFWKPTGGTIEVFGEKLTSTSYEVLKRIGSIIEFPVFYEHLSGESNLKLHCEYIGYDNQRGIENALDLLGLKDASKKPVKQYSLGMKQRLGIARAVLTKPELLILDEPTNGLDPIGMKQMRDLFRMLKEELGVTIMISTHILSEIEDIADTVGIINHGQMIREISTKEISQMRSPYIEVEVQDVRKAMQTLGGFLLNDDYKIVGENMLRIYSENITPQEITKALLLEGNEIISIGKKAEHLEDYFMHLMGEGEKVEKG